MKTKTLIDRYFEEWSKELPEELEEINEDDLEEIKEFILNEINSKKGLQVKVSGAKDARSLANLFFRLKIWEEIIDPKIKEIGYSWNKEEKKYIKIVEE